MVRRCGTPSGVAAALGLPAPTVSHILRRLEAEQTQQTQGVSAVLARNRVVGFSTYGEQVNGMHVNQTMTGVAIFAPDPIQAGDR